MSNRYFNNGKYNVGLTGACPPASIHVPHQPHIIIYPHVVPLGKHGIIITVRVKGVTVQAAAFRSTALAYRAVDIVP